MMLRQNSGHLAFSKMSNKKSHASDGNAFTKSMKNAAGNPNLFTRHALIHVSVSMILIAISAPWSGDPGHDLVKAYFSYCGISLLALVTLYYNILNIDAKIESYYNRE